MSRIRLPYLSLLEQATLICKKISSLSLHLRATSKKNIPTILRPGLHAGEWQRWKLPSIKEEAQPNSLLKETQLSEKAEPILLDATSPPPLSISKLDWIIGVPTRDLIVLPLWVASQGDLQELVMLELSSKHLLRRGMSEGLKMITLKTQEDRTLVVVFAPAAQPSLLNAPYLKEARHFEAAARLLPIDNVDLVIWRELDEISLGFVKNNEYLWLSGSGENQINSFLLGLIQRIAFHLQAESVLEEMPHRVRLIGSFSIGERELLQKNLSIAQSACEHINELPAPIIPKPLLDLPSLLAREARFLGAKRDRIKKIASLALMGYFCLLSIGATNLLLKKIMLAHFSHQLLAASTTLEKATREITEWQEFRFSVDPTTYVLDLLAAIGSQIRGEKIRLTSLADVDGLLQITGEASDVSAAYHFIDLIKKVPEFHDYEWSKSQPKLAGKNSVRFEIEGSLPHAQTSSK